MLSLPDFKEKQIVFVFVSQDEKLSFKNDNIVVKNTDGKIIHQSSCYKLFALYVVGNITITSGLLQRAKKFGFGIVLMGHNLRPYGTWNSETEGNFLLREKQYSYSSLSIARHIIKNKIGNQIHVLKKIRQKDKNTKETIKRIEEYQQKLSDESLDISKILGMEGIASREYFKILFGDCNWISRKPRVKHDSINSLQDIGYTILFNFVEGLLCLYGFDLYKGVYHQCFYQRKSLVCDLVEPFRPIIDARIRKAYSLKEIKEKDFTIINNQYQLFGKVSRPYVDFLLKSILKYKSPIFLYMQKYYRQFIRERPIDEYPVFDLKDTIRC